MSQRGYRLRIVEGDEDGATFSLLMGWDAIEPYVLNGDGIDSFNSCGNRTMVIDIEAIRGDAGSAHYELHRAFLEKLCLGEDRSVAVFDIS